MIVLVIKITIAIGITVVSSWYSYTSTYVVSAIVATMLLAVARKSLSGCHEQYPCDCWWSRLLQRHF